MCGILMEEENYPWRKLYNIVTERREKEIALVSMYTMDGTYAETAEKNVEVMLHGL